MVAMGNEELKALPRIELGEMITCPSCGKLHRLHGGVDKEGRETDYLLFYRCGTAAYLAGVQGRNVIKKSGGKA